MKLAGFSLVLALAWASIGIVPAQEAPPQPVADEPGAALEETLPGEFPEEVNGSSQPRLTTPEGPLYLTPDSAARMALERSTDIALALERIELARGDILQADSVDDWRVEGMASHTRRGPSVSLELPGGEGEDGEDGEPMSLSLSPTAISSLSVTVTKPLYLWGRDRFGRRAAEAGLEAQTAQVQAIENSLALGARQLVLSIMRTEQLHAVVQQRITAVAEHLRVAEAMFEEGMIPRFEVVQAETELSRVRGDLIKLQTAIGRQKAALRRLLNLPQDLVVHVEEGVPPVTPEGTLPELVQSAFLQRGEFKVLDAAIRAAQLQVRLAESYNAPSLGLQGQAQKQTATATGGTDSWSLTVALSKPLYRSNEKAAQVQRAEANLNTTILNLEKTQQEVALEVTQALLELTDAREALSVAEQGEVEARERLRIADIRFRNGVSLGVEVIDAQTALSAAQAEVVNARYNLQTAVVQLRAALGHTDIHETDDVVEHSDENE